MQAVVNLALAAPGGAAGQRGQFLDRLDVAWLEAAYGDGLHGAPARSAPPNRTSATSSSGTPPCWAGSAPPSTAPARLADADAWYCILEGTREQSVAEAQAMAITELVAHAATSPDGEPRAMLLAADDYSAVSRRVPLSNLYERGRSLGLGVHGLRPVLAGPGR